MKRANVTINREQYEQQIQVNDKSLSLMFTFFNMQPYVYFTGVINMLDVDGLRHCAAELLQCQPALFNDNGAGTDGGSEMNSIYCTSRKKK